MLLGDQGLLAGLIFYPWSLQLQQPFKWIKEMVMFQCVLWMKMCMPCEVAKERKTCKEFKWFHGMDSVISSQTITPKLKTSDLFKGKTMQWISKTMKLWKEPIWPSLLLLFKEHCYVLLSYWKLFGDWKQRSNKSMKLSIP